MLSLKERIELINKSTSLNEIPLEALPKAYKEDYYFVSYSHKDYKKVLNDILAFEEMGINIWYDAEMHIGDNWEEIAQLYISKFQCKGIIFYLSENSITSKACNKEVDYVLKHNKKYISVNIPLSNMPVQSGEEMLNTLIKRGFEPQEGLVKSFNKVFPSNILYLSQEDDNNKKGQAILQIKGEDLYSIKWNPTFGNTLTRVRDNGLITLDVSKKAIPTDSEQGISDQEDYIKQIDECCFANFLKLEKIILSDECTYFKQNSFRNAEMLAQIIFDPSNHYVSIDDNAFNGCINLTSFPFGKTNLIGNRAFFGCKSLKDINVCLDLPGVLGKEAFAYSGIESITISGERIVLQDHSVAYCDNLKRVEIKNNISQELGTTFNNNPNLEYISPLFADKEVIVKTSVFGTFSSCKKLPYMRLSGDFNIDKADHMFARCENIKTIDLELKNPNRIPVFFASECKSLENIELNNFIEIGMFAFSGCKSLKEVDLHKCEILGKNAFFSSGVTSVYLDNVKIINPSAFEKCERLHTIFIGDKLEEISFDVFRKDKLTNLIILSSNFKYNEYSFSHELDVLNFYLTKEQYKIFKNKNIIKDTHNIFILDKNGDVTFHGYRFKTLRNHIQNPTIFAESPYSLSMNEPMNRELFIYQPTLEDDITINAANEDIALLRKNGPLVSSNLVGRYINIKTHRYPENFVIFVESVKHSRNKIESIKAKIDEHNFVIPGSIIENIKIIHSLNEIKNYLKIDSSLEADLAYVTISTKTIESMFMSHPIIIKDHNSCINSIVYIENNELHALPGNEIETMFVFDSHMNCVLKFIK